MIQTSKRINEATYYNSKNQLSKLMELLNPKDNFLWKINKALKKTNITIPTLIQLLQTRIKPNY